MAHSRSADAASGRAVPVGSLHAPEADEGAGQARLLAVLHLFYLAHREERAASLSQRDHRASRARIFPAEFLRDHAGHPADPAAEWRALAVQGARHVGGYAVVELWHLQRLRADRARAHPGTRGIHPLGKIGAEDARLE